MVIVPEWLLIERQSLCLWKELLKFYKTNSLLWKVSKGLKEMLLFEPTGGGLELILEGKF